MKMSSRLLAASAALVMGSFVVDASYAEYNGPKNRVESSAGSKSFGLAVKGVVVVGDGNSQFGTTIQSPSSQGGFFFYGEASLAAQKNWSKVKIKDGWGPASGDAHSFAGSTASTKSGGGGCCGGGGGGGLGAASVGDGGGGGGYGGGSGTSASSFGGSSASASVGGGGHDDD